MIIHEGYEDLKLKSPIVTMGIFDGVHLGHKKLLSYLRSKASETGSETAVITFSPHPRLVLEKNDPVLSFLTTFDEKKALLAKEKIDHLIVIEFTRRFGNIHACDFVKDILIKKIGAAKLIVGHDHHFGRKGEGDYATIKKCTEEFGFNVEQVKGFRSDGKPVSASGIREALLSGNLEQANKWLGYDYTVSGTIVGGRMIGRTIGYPTANIQPDSVHKLIPANGVYAVEVRTGKGNYPGMLSIGTNPTVNIDPRIRSIEVHILNFSDNIYGQNISVVFRKWLREEKKFDNLEQLTIQMDRDKQDTLRHLS